MVTAPGRGHSSISSAGGSKLSSRSGFLANRFSTRTISPVRNPARSRRRYAAARSFSSWKSPSRERQTVLFPDPLFDQGLVVDSSYTCRTVFSARAGATRRCRRSCITRVRPSFVRQAGRRETLGETAVVEIAVLFQPRQNMRPRRLPFPLDAGVSPSIRPRNGRGRPEHLSAYVHSAVRCPGVEPYGRS